MNFGSSAYACGDRSGTRNNQQYIWVPALPEEAMT